MSADDSVMAEQASRIVLLEAENEELKQRVRELECRTSALETTLQEILDQTLNANESEDNDEEPEVIAIVKPWITGGNHSRHRLSRDPYALPVFSGAYNPSAASAVASTSAYSYVYPSHFAWLGPSAPSVASAAPFLYTSSAAASPVPSISSASLATLGIPLSERSAELFNAATDGQTERVRHLIGTGLDVNFKINQSSPLHRAALKGHVDILSLLIDHGARLNVQDEDGDTPLHLATVCGFTVCVARLLDAGAMINVRNHDGDTPLHKAAQMNRYGIVRCLLNGGADPDIENNNHNLPRDLALSHGIRRLL